MFACTHVGKCRMSACLHACMHACMHAFMLNACVRMYACTHVRIYVKDALDAYWNYKKRVAELQFKGKTIESIKLVQTDPKLGDGSGVCAEFITEEGDTVKATARGIWWAVTTQKQSNNIKFLRPLKKQD